MTIRRTAPVLALIVSVASPPLRAETARDLYVAALARGEAVRAALAADDASPAMLTDVRSVVAAYREVVKQFPANGYSDNALWQAGVLSLDAFVRFDQAQDKDTGVRLLRALARTYPTSKLVKHVPDQLARVGAGLETRLATIRNIQRAVLPDAVRVTIELDSEVPFHEEHLDSPARVFIDFASTRAAPPLVDRTLRFTGDDAAVRQVRIGRHPNGTTRVVVDAIGVSGCGVYPLYDPYRLVIDCVRARDAEILTARSLGSDWGLRLPSVTPRSTALIADAMTLLAPPPSPPPALEGPAVEAAVGRGAPARNAGGGFSIARQLGLSVSRIVIDPGHGGHDPGAQGRGVDEADLVLDVALRLEKLLQRNPDTEVILTRRTDDFVSLQERTAIANREGADLFLSVHANASQTAQTRGVETYFLNFANSMDAAAVAARENAASGQAMGALPDFVKAIALNNKLDESRDLATGVQRAMVERLRGANKNVKDLGVKQAPFVVLIGAAMPSVLAEIAFVTNAQEARLLRGNAYRQRIAEALFNAIRKYQKSLKVGTLSGRAGL